MLKHLFKGAVISRSVAKKPIQGAFLPQVRVAAMSTSNPPKLEHVAINTEEGIAIIKYNRPKSGNALNTPTLKVRR